jgi:DNA-directed RNA polymerase specialized sigma24 family protein
MSQWTKQDTCWTLIRQASDGDTEARSEFGRRYLSVVREYLRARWTGRLAADEIDDAIGEVFVECLKSGGLLERARAGEIESFHACLYGVVRNIARRVEERRAKRRDAPGSSSFKADLVARDEDRLSVVFDGAWARVVMRQAAERHKSLARESGAEALRRVELLALRFEEGLPIRDIAQIWDDDPARLHHEYARARKEFRTALREVVAYHHPGSPEAVDDECQRLLTQLG